MNFMQEILYLEISILRNYSNTSDKLVYTFRSIQNTKPGKKWRTFARPRSASHAPLFYYANFVANAPPVHCYWLVIWLITFAASERIYFQSRSFILDAFPHMSAWWRMSARCHAMCEQFNVTPLVLNKRARAAVCAEPHGQPRHARCVNVP